MNKEDSRLFDTTPDFMEKERLIIKPDKIGDFRTPPVYSVPCVWKRTDKTSQEHVLRR